MQNGEIITFEVDPEEAGQRLDQWLASKLLDVSRSQIKKWISDGHTVIDGEIVTKSSYKVKSAQVIEAGAVKPEIGKLTPTKMDLDIIFEDDDLIVLNKAANVVVHPGAGTKEPTLIEGVLYHVGELEGGESFRPGIVHRLDKDTSGVMVVAKNEIAHRKLAEQFANKTNDRQYVAILDGNIPNGLTVVESYLHRDPDNRLRFTHTEVEDYRRRNGDQQISGYRWAKSEFTKKLEFAGRLSLCFIKLHTGRTHQIRVHAKQLGAAVLGDQLYNSQTTLPSTFKQDVIQRVKGLSRQMLHARLLGFVHPTTGEKVSFEAPLPEDFKDLVGALKPYAAG